LGIEGLFQRQITVFWQKGRMNKVLIQELLYFRSVKRRVLLADAQIPAQRHRLRNRWDCKSVSLSTPFKGDVSAAAPFGSLQDSPCLWNVIIIHTLHRRCLYRSPVWWLAGLVVFMERNHHLHSSQAMSLQ
jgi:hypothetical protein